tara:strand:- start:245 stop:406 length:162 start_codon:yes stop_codon:yes gene_type:complete
MIDRLLAEDIVRCILCRDKDVPWENIWEYEPDFINLVNEVEDLLTDARNISNE